MLKKIKTILKFLMGKERSIQVMDGSIISKDSLIGNYTYIGYNCNVTKSVIGRYCSIANNVSIGSGEHDIYEISTSALFYNLSYEKLTEKDCIIGNDVWIGVDSIIRRGVKIGNGAVVGANSFVNKDVPDFAIVAGNPAKFIKFRFNDMTTIKKICDTKWWDYDFPEAKSIINKLKENLEICDQPI